MSRADEASSAILAAAAVALVLVGAVVMRRPAAVTCALVAAAVLYGTTLEGGFDSWSAACGVALFLAAEISFLAVGLPRGDAEARVTLVGSLALAGVAVATVAASLAVNLITRINVESSFALAATGAIAAVLLLLIPAQFSDKAKRSG